MKTTIYACRRYQVAETKTEIPLNENLSVNYDEYLARIQRVYDDRIDRDLTKIF